ncbi:T9SS type A sorting domain-containing protein [Kaistella sp. BT6-1-3]|uniref:T9SS type A sorting domain-containing protein n=1 Tax=Kaistella yananensis TaxID=2989820 RepID=A0ABT3JJ70_9FLAO|nr:T9SS type A sorting domain-containing protein [Kaistella yananensis]MCW4450804.1 T9SS type A sorting domain-containing protein [Kaistella yananensis]
MNEKLSSLKAGLFLLLLLASTLITAQIQSFQNGNWNTPSTWVGNIVPSQNDEVQINHQVTLSNFTYRNAKTTVVAGARLVLNQGIQHEFTNPAAFPDVSGVLEIGAGGYLTGNGPQYHVGSELYYASGGVYGRSIEWGWGADIYKPFNVTVKTGTSVNIGANGATNQELEVRGNLTVQPNGNLYMDYGTDQMNQPLFVKGNATVYGQLMLSNNAGGDIKINGDFTCENSGRFFPKVRAVIFTGLNGSIHNVTNNNTAVNPFVIPYLVYQPTSGATTVNLLGATNYHISAPNGGAVIRHASGSSSRISIGARKLTIGSTGIENYIQYGSVVRGTTYIVGGNDSNLELRGTGDLGYLNFISVPVIGRSLRDFTVSRSTGSIGVTISTDLKIMGLLGLQGGIIHARNIISIDRTASITPALPTSGNFIIADKSTGGILRKYLPLGKNDFSFHFPIGDEENSADGINYSPIAIAIKKADLPLTLASNRGYLDVQVNDEPAIPGVEDNYLSRYWSVKNDGITNPKYNVVATFIPTDVVGVLKDGAYKDVSLDVWYKAGNVTTSTIVVNSGINLASGNTNWITATEKLKKNEISVSGNGIEIFSGDTTPELLDNTDFGSTSPGNIIEKQFRIKNTGTKKLIIRDISILNQIPAVPAPFSLITTSAPFNGSFSGTLEPSGTVGDYVDLTVSFTGEMPVGDKFADLFIDNNDANESDYTFRIKGNVNEYVSCNGFRILANQNFEPSAPSPNYSYTVEELNPDGNAIIAGGQAFANSNLKFDKFIGSQSLQVFSANSLVKFSPVNLSTATDPNFELSLAAFGYTSASGLKSGDYVLVEMSTDGLDWKPQIRLNAGNNTNWNYSLPGTFKRAYSTGPVSTIGLGNNSLDFANVKYIITGIPKAATLYVRIQLYSQDNQSIWALDNVMIVDNTSSKTWNGTSWNGVDSSPPTFQQKAIIDGNLTTTPATSFSTCECEVKSGKTLTIGPDSYVEVQGNITNNGEIIVKSDGNLKQINKDAVNTNDIKVRREFTWSLGTLRREYNYLSSPVELTSVFTMKHIFGNNTDNVPVVTVLRESTNSFVNAVPSDYQNSAGKGFAVREARYTYDGVGTDGIAPNEAQFKGKPNNGDIILPISYTPGRGYNLAGNPYPSNIDINAVYNDPLTKNIHPEFRFWDNTVNATYVQMGGAYQGYSYAIFNAATEPGVGYGVAAPGNDKGGPAGTKIPGSIIKVSQGFMVRANAVGAQLSFRNSMRRTTNAGTQFFGKESPRNRYRLQLVKADGFTIQNAIAYFDAGKTDFGIEDTRIPNSSASDALFTYAGDAKVVINGRSSFTAEDVLTLGTRHYTTGNYTIQAVDEEGEFARGQAIYLKDKTLGIITDLTKGDYSFTSEAGEYTNRFEIVYTPALVLATDTVVKSKLEVYRDATDFVVSSSEHPIARIEVYDVSGRLVLTVHGQSKELRFSAERLLNGMYLLKAQLKNGEQLTKKIRK